jgi:hypothetical protein
MKKNILNSRKLIYFLTMLLAVLIVTSCLANGNYVNNNVLEDNMVEDVNIDIVGEDPSPNVVGGVISKINDLIEKIVESPEDCWRKPAQNRKDTMIYKLTSLKELILQELFEEAYNKMLHDIKPKLTALKTDENEEPWGNGTFKQPWVVCEDLRNVFRVDCNSILNDLISE